MHLIERTSRGAVPFDRLRRAISRLSAAERHAAAPTVLNQLADEVITSRNAIFEEKLAQGWTPSAAERAQHESDALLLRERADY